MNVAIWMLLALSLPGSALAEIACSSAPLDGCKRATRPRTGRLVLRDRSPDTRDSFVWSWKHGNETRSIDLGEPDSFTDYVVCVYEEGNSVPVLEAHATATPGCPGSACWTRTGDGRYVYINKTQEPDGMRFMRLRAGDEGKARVNARGKGENLQMPALPLALPLRVQAQNDKGECWEGRFGQFVVKNDESLLRANADGTPCGEALQPQCSGDCAVGLQCTNIGSSCGCWPPCGDAVAPVCEGACPDGFSCADPGSGCTCSPCGNVTLEPGQACDDGNLADGDGCSRICRCNPVTTPDVCNVTGDWATPGLVGMVSVVEDSAGNSTNSGMLSTASLSGQASRSDSCGTGTGELDFGGGPVPITFRVMVHDDCNRMTFVVDHVGGPAPPIPIVTLERVMSSPSGAFLERAASILD